MPKFFFVVFLFVLHFNNSYGNRTMEPYIVGGSYARISAFPHSVFLMAECQVEYTCGSSILNQNILLTAAHCTEDCTGSFKITALAGNENILGNTLKRKVRRFISHPNYNTVTVQSDIALLMVKYGFVLGPAVQRVILAPYTKYNEGDIAGWGITNDETETETTKLKMVTQHFMNDCHKIVKLKGVICAKARAAHKNHPAAGDSGSALMLKNHHQVGLVSFRSKFDIGTTIYTNVSHFYYWITEKSKYLYCYKGGK